MAKIHNPHDKIFKNVISDRDNAVSLLRNILPEPVQKHLALEEMQYEKDSYVPKHLQKYFSELLTSFHP
ncbi:MAG: Rpn family recombination-promoting nuclease/putative transposase [Thermodesulfobacteriota bacterium]